MNQLKAIQSFICQNQKDIIKYEYNIAQSHKKLKNYFYSTIDITIEELEKTYEKLIIQSYKEMIIVFNKNKPKIDEIFKQMGKDSPRISIKTINNDSVLDLYRNGYENDFRLSSIKDNTAFDDILNNNQKYYLQNNLEELFLTGKYKNNRLNANLKNDLKNKKVSWQQCWEPYASSDTIDTQFYNSTMVIPMAIRSNENDYENDKEFYDHFFTNVSQNRHSRTVWGFLCFDHTSKDFFNNEEDMLSVGYIIADILSLYLMFFYNYISASQTVNDVIEKIHEMKE